MNVLLVVDMGTLTILALVPGEKLAGLDLDAINGQTLNEDEVPKKIAKQIVKLCNRLGLGDKKASQDLIPFVDPQPPFTVDKLIRFGWAD